MNARKRELEKQRGESSKIIKKNSQGTSLTVQWLGLHVSTAADMVRSLPGWGTKIPQASQHGQKKEKKRKIPNIWVFQILGAHHPKQWWGKSLKKIQLHEISQHQGQREDLTRFWGWGERNLGIKISSDFSTATLESLMQWSDVIKILRRIISNWEFYKLSVKHIS